MSAAGPVLRDIHLPPAAWWPLAPGWWVIAGLLVLILVVVAGCLLRRKRASLVATVTREIDALEAAYACHHDAVALAAGASRLLRRLAVRMDPAAASAHGAAWCAFLQQRARSRRDAEMLATLTTAAFQRTPAVDAGVLLTALRAWCTHAMRKPHPVRAVAALRRGTQ